MRCNEVLKVIATDTFTMIMLGEHTTRTRNVAFAMQYAIYNIAAAICNVLLDLPRMRTRRRELPGASCASAASPGPRRRRRRSSSF